MTTISVEEIIEYLSMKEAVQLETDPAISIAELSMRILPEMSEEDREVLEASAIACFAQRIAGGLDVNSSVAETFLRGVEFGREVERRTR